MKPTFDRVCVIGLGYVGLPTAAILASRGIDVLGVDTNEDTVSLINRGRTHSVEPDLDIMVADAVATGKLRAATRTEPADAFIIAVPTPFHDDHRPDLAYLRAAAAAAAPVLKKGDLIVIESTSPVGTTESMSGWLADARPDLRFPHQARARADVQLAHSPERVLPGRVLLEMVRNDRVIGGLSPYCAERAAGLYGTFVNGACHLTTAHTAELVKLAENAYRDVNIAFANELSLVCDRMGISVWDVVELSNRHPRVSILQPGPGVGGHCVAVDPWFIVHSAPAETALIRAARRVNDDKPLHVVACVRRAAAEFDRPRIACLGLAYKADIDDVRESPAVRIVGALADEVDGHILVVEPHLGDLPKELQGRSRIRRVELQEALDEADIIVLLVDHQPFKAVDSKRLQGKVVLDTRGLWR